MYSRALRTKETHSYTLRIKVYSTHQLKQADLLPCIFLEVILWSEKQKWGRGGSHVFPRHWVCNDTLNAMLSILTAMDRKVHPVLSEAWMAPSRDSLQAEYPLVRERVREIKMHLKTNYTGCVCFVVWLQRHINPRCFLWWFREIILTEGFLFLICPGTRGITAVQYSLL